MAIKIPAAGPTPTRPSWRNALLLGVPASAVAIGLMLAARYAYQIRTLPERMMDWSLQFIPLDLFEQGIQNLGTSAKEIALVGNYVGFTLTLILIGGLALRGGPRAFAIVGAATWLVAMAVVMPITGAGMFATALPQDVWLTNASYLGVAAAFGTVLALTHTLIIAPRATPRSMAVVASRRAFISGVVGTGAAYALTLWFGKNAGASSSTLPLAKIPTNGAPQLAATPVANQVTSAAVPTTAPIAADASTVGPVATSTIGATGATPVATAATSGGATPTALPSALAVATAPTPVPNAPGVVPPRPAPQQAVARDKDGALSASAHTAGQLSTEFTPANGFYITTKNAGGDPVVDPAKWRLVLDGEVGNPVQVDLATLYQLPSVQIVKTQECISNWVNRCDEVPFGCGLIGNATWKGVRLSDVFSLAGGIKPGVVGILTTSVDEFSSFIPADAALMNDTLLVYEMNGQVLPLEHGYPTRLLVPGRYGMKNPKWVVGIRPSKTVISDWYSRLGWSKDGIVQAMTRIDQPANGATVAAGQQQIAGIAYAGAKGVSKVQFSTDGGNTWAPATILADQHGSDIWARWTGSFTMPATGTLTLAARLIDGAGTPQNTNYTITQPNGGTGLYTATVKAG